MALPLAVGPAVADVLAEWSDPPRIGAEILLWIAWGFGLVMVLAPRPGGLTLLRVLAMGLAAITVGAARGGTAPDGAGAILGAMTILAIVTIPETARWFAEGTAYGDEQRLPLQLPRVIGWVLGPLAAAIACAGIASGPLLLLAGDIPAGAAASGIGLPLAALAVRSLHALSLRWLVLVPGGLVVHDPLTLADPVLLPRERIRAIDPCISTGEHAVDLRLGAKLGPVTITVDPPVGLPVIRRRERITEIVNASSVTVALARPGSGVALARENSARR